MSPSSSVVRKEQCQLFEVFLAQGRKIELVLRILRSGLIVRKCAGIVHLDNSHEHPQDCASKVQGYTVRMSSNQDIETTYSNLMSEDEVVERHSIRVHACRNLLVI